MVGSALGVLEAEGQRIGSLTLMSLSAPSLDSTPATDRFMKIKGLSQKNIERLLQESKDEATKKGLSDTEVAKAETQRKFRWQRSNDLNAKLKSLEAKEDELILQIRNSSPCSGLWLGLFIGISMEPFPRQLTGIGCLIEISEIIPTQQAA